MQILNDAIHFYYLWNFCSYYYEYVICCEFKLITCQLFWWRGRSSRRDGLGRGCSGRGGIGRGGSGGRSRYG